MNNQDIQPLPSSSDLRLGWAASIGLVFLQFWSRYLPSPWAVFVADDWANWARSSFYTSTLEAFLTGLQDPNRPLSMAAVESLYRLFGAQPIYWTLLSIVANSLLLYAVMQMAFSLTGRRLSAALAGIVFALLPNLTETYHWSTQILNQLSCAMVFYAISAWMWIAFVRTGAKGRWIASIAAYGIALFSYEAGILLPAAYVTLLTWRRPVLLRNGVHLLPFGVVFLLYAAWRMTDAFGMNQSWYYPPHMEAGISLWGIGWNVRQIFHWWVGDHLFGSILSGLDSFSTLTPWTRRGLMLGNLLVMIAVGRFLCVRQPAPPGGSRGNPGTVQSSPFAIGQVVLFGIIWTGAALAIPVMSYTASRLMVLPAIGISVLLGWLLSRIPFTRWTGLLLIPSVLALAANQGTAESYRQVGQLNQHLFQHLTETQPEWQEHDAILFDTRALRNRLTPGLLRPVDADPATWAEFNNALLLRGFVLNGMVQLITQDPSPEIHIIHDVEYGARIESDTLHWHARYNPDRPRTTSMNQVFVVDVHAVAVEGDRLQSDGSSLRP